MGVPLVKLFGDAADLPLEVEEPELLHGQSVNSKLENFLIRVKGNKIEREIAVRLRNVNGYCVEFLDILFFLVTLHALYGTSIISKNQILNNRLVRSQLHLGVKIECFI